MKIMAVALSLCMVSSSAAMSAEIITLPAKNGNVSFPHARHQEYTSKSDKKCLTCHATAAGGKIEGFGKDAAHKNCKGCHEEKKAGPIRCGQCHKK